LGLIAALLLAVTVGARGEAVPPQEAAAPDRRQTQGTVRDLGGWSAAERRLGEQMPTGRGIIVGHVEGNPNNYMPDFQSGRYGEVEFVARSGPSTPFGHATATAAVIYGPQGLAPGIAKVHCFHSGDWLGPSLLRTGSPLPPAHEEMRVYSHSWIAGENPHVTEILRRVDFMVDRDDVLIFAGVNNGRNTNVPAMLSSAYNAIIVGTGEANGASSGGYTRYDGPGRCKPDLVGPRRLTSFATPAVAAAGALLLERGDLAPFFVKNASRSEVVKAALMAGATKPWNWRPQDGHPLDEHLGAGVVNVDNALRILDGGPVKPGQSSQRFGWNFASLAPGSHQTYQLVLDGEARPLSVMLVWHRRIDGRTQIDRAKKTGKWLDAPRLADFDLLVSRQVGGEQVQVVQLSRSRVDNVEHVFVPRLEPGVYRVDIIRRRDGHAEPWDFALAWRSGGERHPGGLVDLASQDPASP
jgi:hypothetical protein